MAPTPDQNPGGGLAPPSAFSVLVFFVNGKKVKSTVEKTKLDLALL